LRATKEVFVVLLELVLPVVVASVQERPRVRVDLGPTPEEERDPLPEGVDHLNLLFTVLLNALEEELRVRRDQVDPRHLGLDRVFRREFFWTHAPDQSDRCGLVLFLFYL